MIGLLLNQVGDDRYLLIDDTDEDATEILTVLCERSGARSSRFPEALDLGDLS